MHHIEHLYIDGKFVQPLGTDVFETIDPTTETLAGTVALGNREDTRLAIAAAKSALVSFARTSKAERIAMLQRLHAAVLGCGDALQAATVAEYGGPMSRAAWVTAYAAQSFLDAARVLEAYPLTRQVDGAMLWMEPVGVAALITPWNASAGSVCSKLAMAIAAGCTAVIKPSEFSARQTDILVRALHSAGLPPGVFNIVNGWGHVVGDELATHPDVAKISFTGSTNVGKRILKGAADTMKRVSLALGGKSATLVLDDADLAQAVPLALAAAFMNNGQACVAGSRLLVPRARQAEILERLAAGVAAMQVGDPRDAATTLGPLASRQQFDRVQAYIQQGLDSGARLVAGGAGRPEGLERGFFVRPTVFVDVSSDMAIAREEIFGPVLCVLAYGDEEEAIAMANDSVFGLQAYVVSRNEPRARAVAARLQAGRVLINGLHHAPLAPFGGFKQSGIGREFGVMGLESFLEAKSVIGSPHAPMSADVD